MRVILLLNRDQPAALPQAMHSIPCLMELAGKPILYWQLQELDMITENKIEEVKLLSAGLQKDEKAKIVGICRSLRAEPDFIQVGEQAGWASFAHCLDMHSGAAILAESSGVFRSEFKIGVTAENLAWVTVSEEPTKGATATIGANNQIVGLTEHSEAMGANQVPRPILYLKELQQLKEVLTPSANKNMSFKEFLTKCIANFKLQPFLLQEWLPFSQKRDLLKVNKLYLKELPLPQMVDPSAEATNTVINGPVYIGPNVKVSNSVIGPYVSLQASCEIRNSIICNAVVGQESLISTALIEDSFIGSQARFLGTTSQLNLANYSTLKA